jgi:hypothetical protein
MMTFFGIPGRLLWRNGMDVDPASGISPALARLLPVSPEQARLPGASSSTPETVLAQVHFLAESERGKLLWFMIRVVGTWEANGKDNLRRFCNSMMRLLHRAIELA